MKGTHEELINIEGIGHAFITGVPDKCDHDDKMNVFCLANGDFLLEADYRCPTDEATLEYIWKVAAERNTTVNGGTCACSKCRKVHSIADLMGDAFWE